MKDLTAIFLSMHEGVKSLDPRYEILDSEHVMDTLTNIEYHLESGELWTITKDAKVILDGKEITEEEAHILEQVADCIPKLFVDKKRHEFHTLVMGEPSPDAQGAYKAPKRYIT